MADIELQVKGLKELAAALNELPTKLAGRALGDSVKAAAVLVQNQARSNVAKDTGHLQKSIVAYRKKGSNDKDITYQVGVTMKKKYPKGGKRKGWNYILHGSNAIQPAYYWRFLEFGTAKMAAKPFLRNAFVQRSGQSLALIKKMLAAAVEIAANHAPKYQGR